MTPPERALCRSGLWEALALGFAAPAEDTVRRLLAPEGAAGLAALGAVAAPDRLRLLAQRELLHVADMLAPPFGYDPALPEGVAGGPRERTVRDNYRILWNAYVDGRLTRAGLVPPAVRADRFREFARAFFRLGEGCEAAFARFFDAPELTHADLLGFAAGDVAGAPLARCRLCDMPTRVFDPAPARLPRAALAAIAADFPGWRPADGLCGRCAELYVSRAATSGAEVS